MPTPIIKNEHHEATIKNLIANFSYLKDVLVNKSKSLEYVAKHTNELNRLVAESSGPIPEGEAMQKMLNFSKTPEKNFVKISKNLIDSLLKRVSEEDYKPDDTKYEIGFRFYTGSNSGKYSVIIVPIWISKTGNHDSDLEDRAFPGVGASKKFFAINPDHSTDIFPSKDKCREAIKDTDLSKKEAAIFPFKQLNNYLTGITDGYDSMQLFFARTESGDDKPLTLVMRCLKGTSIQMSNGTDTGYYFNRGDLIPPPDVNDKSF